MAAGDDMLVDRPGAELPPSRLTPAQLYCFEASGYIILRSVLSPELRTAALEDPATLAEHPVLVAALTELMDDLDVRSIPGQQQEDGVRGYFARLNYSNAARPFELLEPPWLHSTAHMPAQRSLERLQQWGDGVHDPSRAYSHDRGSRVCQAMRCTWVLSVANGSDTPCALVPGSHTAEVQIPEELLRPGFDDSELRCCPVLRAGDLLLQAATLVHAVRPARGTILATAEYVTTLTGNWGDPGLAADGSAPEWLARLSPSQQAALGMYAAEPVGPSAAAALRLSAPKREGESLREREERELREATALHPSTLSLSSADAVKNLNVDDSATLEEMYRWDCTGHLILRNVMDRAWVEAALAAIASVRIEADGEERFPLPSGALLGLPEPHAQPFAAMLDHPAVTKRLQWILGPGWVIESAPGPTTATAPGNPLGIHSGGAPTTPINLVRVRHGRTHCEVVKVAWQLRDVNLNGKEDGGYICIPGSHRSRRQLPFGPDFVQEDPMANVRLREDGHMQLLGMNAGDVCIFMAATQTHGAAGWRGEEARRCVIMGIWSRTRARRREQLAEERLLQAAAGTPRL